MNVTEICSECHSYGYTSLLYRRSCNNKGLCDHDHVLNQSITISFNHDVLQGKPDTITQYFLRHISNNKISVIIYGVL